MSANLDSIYREFNRKMGKSSNNRIYEFEEFRLNGSDLMLYRGDEEVSLAPKAVETLLVLIQRRGEIVSKDELMETIWRDTVVEESNLTQYLSRIRKTLGGMSDGRPFIETFRRRGYRFNGQIEITSERPIIHNEPAPRPRETGLSPSIEREGNVLRVVDWRPPEAAPAPEIRTESNQVAAVSKRRSLPG